MTSQRSLRRKSRIPTTSVLHRTRRNSGRLQVACILTAFWIATAIASPAQTFTTIHSFTGPTQGGASPAAGLTQGIDGNFYGTTSSGGGGSCTFGCGTIFKINPTGTLTMLYSFQVPDWGPSSGLIQAHNGNFYGTTAFGGGSSNCYEYNGCGTVYEITPEGMLTTLYSFSELAAPSSGVIQASDGNFYGTTFYGGGGSCTSGCGTIFRLTPEGTLTTLNSFAGTNGTEPGGLVQAADGNFYGTTLSGGAGSANGLDGNGTVFQITPTGTLTMLYSFCTQTNCPDGGGPAILLQAVGGNFYGTTLYGGVYGDGTVFEITPRGTLTTIYSFCAEHGCTDGSEPIGLMQATDGNFYGTTLHGGGDGVGTIFEITAGGTLTTIHTFARSDGANPYAGVMQASDGSFYGTTAYGGASSNCGDGCGTVFTFGLPAIKSATSTTLVSSLNPSIYGQSVTWTATVTTSGSVTPTGTVNFEWGGGLYSFGTAKLNASGVATLTRSTENADAYAMTAVYSGDANNLGSTSAVLNQVINEATTSATLTSSPNPSTVGQSVTFTATISSVTVTPTGPVTFTAGKTVLGTAQLSGGKAKFTTATLAVGATTVTATYAGDSNIAESSASVVQTVTTGSGNSTTTTLTSSLNPASFGDQVTFTAQVKSSVGTPPNGEIVTFYNGSSVIGPGVLNGGAATMTTSSLPGGSFSITASYPGDSSFLGSTSAPLSQVVQTTTTAETVNWVADPPQNETFTATVTGPKGIPTGSVTFTVGNTVLGTSDLNASGVATLTVATLAVGSNTVTAAYGGDANNQPTSAWTTQTFVMPYNATMYLQQDGGHAAAITEFGAGTWPTNFVEYYSGLPYYPNPTGQVLVGSFNAGTIVNVGMYTVWGDLNGWAFSNEVSSNQPSLISFADLSNTLGLNHSITQQTSSTTWVLWLDDAESYLVNDNNQDVIMEIILVPN